jgi:hypothetical protein
MASICNLRSFPQEASSNLIHLLKRPLFDLKDSEEKGLIFFTSRHFSPSFITRAMAIVLQLITGVWCGPAPTTGGHEQETGKKKASATISGSSSTAMSPVRRSETANRRAAGHPRDGRPRQSSEEPGRRHGSLPLLPRKASSSLP